MRGSNRVIAGVAAAAATATLAACSSSGGSGPEPQAQVTSLKGTTTVAIDSGFLTAASFLSVTPTAYGSATLNQSGGRTSVALPITGGKVTVYKPGEAKPAVQGQVEQAGSGLTLATSSAKVIVKDLVIHLADKPTITGEVDLNGKPFAKDAVLFDIDAGTQQAPAVTSAGVTLQGATLYLSSEAADALNTQFDTTALSGGKSVKIGTLTVQATGG